ncbi:MAG: Asp-tRNA(Asn)/Glu-tRNA(Gln) amidotransferase subunit GatC [Lachnospiraceae bacterium]|nr:Asp-tRNA(Asn)/Glu-tRNA(Gln) amidotransferase subunit GatC [Lachnospiraceae bacterium]
MISMETLERVGRLAELEIPENHREAARQDLEKMVTFVDVMRELNVKDVEPLYQVTAERAGMQNVLRDDVVTEGEDREALLGNAPKRRGEFASVPKTFA